jgi:DNA-binding NarL/FixJ family response regulator
MSSPRPIRVLLVDDHRSVLWGLAKLIESENPRIELAGVATCHREAADAMQQHRPDVVLLDLDLGKENGLALVPQLAASAAVLILTGLREEGLAEKAILAGARGVVHKAEPAEVVLKAIVRVHAGEPWVDRGTMGRLLTTVSRARQAPVESDLTAAERKVVAAIVQNKSAPNKTIAARMRISEHTLRNHLTSIYDKLGIRGRVALVLHAMEHELVKATSE